MTRHALLAFCALSLLGPVSASAQSRDWSAASGEQDATLGIRVPKASKRQFSPMIWGECAILLCAKMARFTRLFTAKTKMAG